MTRALLRGVRLSAFAGLLLGGGAVPLVSHAQLAGLFGSTNGTYCKVKKNDVIFAYTQLPLDSSEAFARGMTLRRLASLARSKGFSAMVVTNKGCGTLLINNAPRVRSCKLEARMENTALADPAAKPAGQWLSVERVLSDTQSDAASYPVTTGLMNKGNRCVID